MNAEDHTESSASQPSRKAVIPVPKVAMVPIIKEIPRGPWVSIKDIETLIAGINIITTVKESSVKIFQKKVAEKHT
jgi:hypothetical protein